MRYRVLVVVEGFTEKGILDNCFVEWKEQSGIDLRATLVRTNGGVGGNAYKHARRNIIGLLGEDRDAIVTMCFDYYGLDRRWPGVDEAREARAEDIPGIICRAIEKDIHPRLSYDGRRRFIPHIQMHEIESLLFADPDAIARALNDPALAKKIAAVVAECGGCERINHNPATTPSNRLVELCPAYAKGDSDDSHAHRILNEADPQRVISECPNFGKWLGRIADRAKAA